MFSMTELDQFERACDLLSQAEVTRSNKWMRVAFLARMMRVDDAHILQLALLACGYAMRQDAGEVLCNVSTIIWPIGIEKCGNALDDE